MKYIIPLLLLFTFFACKQKSDISQLDRKAKIAMHTLDALKLDLAATECISDAVAEHCIGYLREETPVAKTEKIVDEYTKDHDHFEQIEGRLFKYEMGKDSFTINFLITGDEVRIIVKET